MNNFETKEDIGYVVWGTKEELSYIFNSAHIDPNSGEIRDTLNDIREIVLFSDPKVDFYSMKFTSQYKIYTQYRSLYDWIGQEGFMAMTIYIPCSLKPNDGVILHLLNNTINYFWDNYVNEIYQIKNEIKENKAWFDDAVHIPLKKDKELKSASPQNDTFGLIRYKDENELSIYLDNPCRREYNQFQEILFIEQSEQQFPEMEILDISPAIPRYTVAISSEANVSSEFQVNGEVVDDLDRLSVYDEIKMVFKKPYHQSISWQGTVEQLVQKSQKRLRGNTIPLNLPVFTPYKREIQFAVRDAKTSLPISDFSIAVNNQTTNNTRII